MLLVGCLILAGCSSPQFTDTCYLYREKPGPVAAGVRAVQRKALDDDQSLLVKREAMKIHHHKLYTNTPPLPELSIPAHAKAKTGP